MGKRTRILLKILVVAVLSFLLIQLIYQDQKKQQIAQPKGELMPAADVEILLTALEEAGRENKKGELSDGEWRSCLEREGEYLRYGEYLELLEHLGKESGRQEEYESLREELTYRKKYKKEFLLLKEDWYDSYTRLVQFFGLENILRKEKVEILCGNRNLVGSEKIGEDCILDANGRVYSCESEALKELQFTAVKAFGWGERLLTLTEPLEEEYSLSNVWIMEAGDGRIQFFVDGYEILAENAQMDGEGDKLREQAGDISFRGGAVSQVRIKKNRISGKLLGISEDGLEIEGAGNVPLDADCVGYQLCGELRNAAVSELSIGYDFADYVVEEGRICAFLIVKKEAMETIRVAIKNSGFAGLYHDRIELSCEDDMIISYGSYEDRKQERIPAGEMFTAKPGDQYFSGGRVEVSPVVNTGKIQVHSLERSQGMPAYRGEMEIVETKEGLALINEVLLEEYLYSVVPSEMPAAYPMEALKAQAVCARTYGYRYLEHPGYQSLGAHVDDSVGYQVYNNIEENVNSTKAVRETAGELLWYEGEPVSTYYYSTSCGFGTDAGVWNEAQRQEMPYLNSVHIASGKEQAEGAADEESYSPVDLSDEEKFRSYIYQADEDAYEKNESWFRWHYYVEELDAALMAERLEERYRAGKEKVLTYTGNGDPDEDEEGFTSEEPEKFRKVYDIRSMKRREGGVMDELLIETDQGTYKVKSEYNIRYILNQGGEVTRQDGSVSKGASLLPSAYLAIDVVKQGKTVIGYTIIGGGYGHGVGMSQNGARAMGEEQMGYERILTFYYRDCEIHRIY